jgi:uncharacterized membrane protein HdeD (DUF308 family)
LSPVAVGNAVVKLVALVLVVTGLVQLVQALRAASATQRAVSGVLGAIVAGVGVLVWFNPEVGSGFLTALLMIFFVVNGLWKISSALRFRPAAGWAWLLLAGFISLVFVYLLWSQWPLAGAWAIGVLVGLDLLLGSRWSCGSRAWSPSRITSARSTEADAGRGFSSEMGIERVRVRGRRGSIPRCGHIGLFRIS